MLLLDDSAWARLSRPGVPGPRRQQLAGWMREGQLATSLPFLLEAGYSARSADAHRTLLTDLLLLPRVALTAEIEGLALAAQSELARVGHHRLAPADLIIAACAHQTGAGVLHYDHDYDLIAEHTALSFDSAWLAQPGELD